MASFTCPYCQCVMAVSPDTHKNTAVSVKYTGASTVPPSPGQIQIDFYVCPACKEVTIVATIDCDTNIGEVFLKPQSYAKKFPAYIPKAILQDYEEAYAIVSLSPKSSATLSRRCLQGMIRDFWSIRESNLSKAIDCLEGKIPNEQWNVINGVRRIGNIGAHMEKDINLIVDIEPDEAEKLIKLIELLIKQWYIERHEQEELFADIISIDTSKQLIRKKMD